MLLWKVCAARFRQSTCRLSHTQEFRAGRESAVSWVPACHFFVNTTTSPSTCTGGLGLPNVTQVATCGLGGKAGHTRAPSPQPVTGKFRMKSRLLIMAPALAAPPVIWPLPPSLSSLPPTQPPQTELLLPSKGLKSLCPSASDLTPAHKDSPSAGDPHPALCHCLSSCLCPSGCLPHPRLRLLPSPSA